MGNKIDRTEKGGELLYRCRQCYCIDNSTHVPNIMRALTDINIFGVTQNRGIKARMTSVHICKNGGWGISDLIGAEEDREE